MFNVIYGDSKFDRHAELYKKLRNNINNNIKSYILVPEQFSVFTERKVIQTLGVSAQTLVEVLTFSRLGNEVLSLLGPLRLNNVDGAVKEILSSRALQLIENKLSYLKSNVHQQGFSSVLVTLISEFKRYGITIEKLRETSEEIEKTELKNKLADLATFYEMYQSLIEEKNTDSEDNLSIILPKIKDFDSLIGSELFVIEFKSFTPLEHDILVEMIKKADSATLILCCDDIESPDDIFLPAKYTYSQLKESVENYGIKVSTPQKLSITRNANDDLIHLWDNFFKIHPKKHKSPDNIHIISPENYYSEVETTAKIIHKLCRTKGYKQSDFLVLARDTENYDRLMPLIFSKMGINVFLDKRRSMMQNPYLGCLTAALEILAFGFSYERVMLIAKSGFIKNVTVDEIDIFDNYILAVNPSHAMWNEQSDWTFNPDKKQYDMEQINKVKKTILDPIFMFKKNLKGTKTVADIINAIFAYIDYSNHEDIMKGICDEFSNSNMIYLAEEYRQTWNNLISILSQMSEIMVSDNITYQKFYDLFTSACSGIKVGVSPQTIDGVLFSKIDLFRNNDAKVVIVLGVNAGVFPKGYSAEGLITDSERELLRDYGVSLAMTMTEKSKDEQLLVYNVLSAPSDELYLMSPLFTNDGTELDESKIITKIRTELFDFSQDNSEHGSNILTEIESYSVAFDEVLKAISMESGNTQNLSPDYKALYDFFMSDPDTSNKINYYSKKIISLSDSYTALSKESVKLLYGKDIMLSASKLEKYNACAFSYFMRYGLVAMPRDKASFDPMSMGNVLHETLDAYFSTKANEDADYNTINKDMCETEISHIVNDIAKASEDVMYQTSAYYKYLLSRIAGIASTTAWETIKFYQNSEFRPYGFEIKISDDGDIPPLKITVPEGSATVIGFVDRADSAVINGQRYISILDYKSSVRDLDVNLANAGVHFQPLVYTNAICGSSDIKPAAMLYQQMNDPIINSADANTQAKLDKKIQDNVKASGWLIDEERIRTAFDKTNLYVKGKDHNVPETEMNERLKKAQNKIAETTTGIFSGNISINPYTRFNFNPCSYCDYKNICQNKD